MNTQITLEGDLIMELLKALNTNRKSIVGVTYYGDFRDTDPDKAGAPELLTLTLELLQTVGVELLATFLVEFIQKKIKERSERKNENKTSDKELRIVNSDIDLYAKNYTKEEVVEILKALSSKKK